MEHVAVIGAGITGLCTAWYLQQHGVRVTVLDRAHVAAGASWGNAGQINPAFTVPLPAPGQLWSSMRAAISPSGALTVPLTLDPAWWRFIIRFAAHCTPARWERAMTLLTELTKRAIDAFDEISRNGVASRLQPASPFMAACSNTTERTHLQQELDAVASHDDSVSYQVVTGDDLRALEPHLSKQVQTGLRIAGQHYVDPPGFLHAMASAVRTRGGTVQERTRVIDLHDHGTEVEVSTNTTDPIRADAAVVATGAWLNDLVSRFGVRVGVQAGRGYSFSLTPRHPPTHPIYLPGRKIVCTPLGDRFRVTGIMELRRPDAVRDPRRLRQMIRTAQPMFTGVDWDARHDEWCGSRPLTPDGIPLVGATASPRVFVSGGHGMWGMTHGPITGKLLAESMLGHPVPPWMSQMDPRR